jgi:hypothetical protein
MLPAGAVPGLRLWKHEQAGEAPAHYLAQTRRQVPVSDAVNAHPGVLDGEGGQSHIVEPDVAQAKEVAANPDAALERVEAALVPLGRHPRARAQTWLSPMAERPATAPTGRSSSCKAPSWS